MDQDQFFKYLKSCALPQIKEILRVVHWYEKHYEDAQRRTVEEARRSFAFDEFIKPKKTLSLLESDYGVQPSATESLVENIESQDSLSDRQILQIDQLIQPSSSSNNRSEMENCTARSLQHEDGYERLASFDGAFVAEHDSLVGQKRPRSFTCEPSVAALSIHSDDTNSTDISSYSSHPHSVHSLHSTQPSHSSHTRSMYTLHSTNTALTPRSLVAVGGRDGFAYWDNSQSEDTLSTGTEESADGSRYAPSEAVSLPPEVEQVPVSRKRQRTGGAEDQTHTKQEHHRNVSQESSSATSATSTSHRSSTNSSNKGWRCFTLAEDALIKKRVEEHRRLLEGERGKGGEKGKAGLWAQLGREMDRAGSSVRGRWQRIQKESGGSGDGGFSSSGGISVGAGVSSSSVGVRKPSVMVDLTRNSTVTGTNATTSIPNPTLNTTSSTSSSLPAAPLPTTLCSQHTLSHLTNLPTIQAVSTSAYNYTDHSYHNSSTNSSTSNTSKHLCTATTSASSNNPNFLTTSTHATTARTVPITTTHSTTSTNQSTNNSTSKAAQSARNRAEAELFVSAIASANTNLSTVTIAQGEKRSGVPFGTDTTTTDMGCGTRTSTSTAVSTTTTTSAVTSTTPATTLATTSSASYTTSHTTSSNTTPHTTTSHTTATTTTTSAQRSRGSTRQATDWTCLHCEYRNKYLTYPTACAYCDTQRENFGSLALSQLGRPARTGLH